MGQEFGYQVLFVGEKMKIVFIGMSAEYSLRHLEILEEKFNVVMIVCAALRGYHGSNEKITNHNVLYKNSKDRGIPFYFTKNVSSKEIEEAIRKTNCDLICIASCSQLIKKILLIFLNVELLMHMLASCPTIKGLILIIGFFINKKKKGHVQYIM